MDCFTPKGKKAIRKNNTNQKNNGQQSKFLNKAAQSQRGV